VGGGRGGGHGVGGKSWRRVICFLGWRVDFSGSAIFRVGDFLIFVILSLRRGAGGSRLGIHRGDPGLGGWRRR